MKKGDIKELSKYFLFGLVLLLLFLSYKVVEPFVVTIVSAFVLTFFSKPLYDKLHKKMNRPHAALVCILLVILIVIVPLAGLVTGITAQSEQLAEGMEEVPEFMEGLNSSGLLESLNVDLTESVKDLSRVVGSAIGSAISYLPQLIISFVILIFGMYYLLLNWDSLVKRLSHYIPISNKKKVMSEISDITTQIVHVFFFIAIIEFIIAIAGFYLSGVGPFLIFAVLIFFLAFIPGLGAAIVWIPMAIYYIYTGEITAFLGVLITGLLLTILIEVILRSKVAGDRTKINPFVMLVGTLGGIGMFGILGFVLGPLILNYAIKVIGVLSKEMVKNT